MDVKFTKLVDVPTGNGFMIVPGASGQYIIVGSTVFETEANVPFRHNSVGGTVPIYLGTGLWDMAVLYPRGTPPISLDKPFDGDTIDPDGYIRYRWEGAVGNSESVMESVTYPVGYGMQVLGFYSSSSGNLLIATNGVDATFSWDGTSWTQIIGQVFSAGIQFEGKFWLIAPPSGTNIQGGGGVWDPANGFVAMDKAPRGATIVAHKDRLWVAPGRDSRVENTRIYLTVFDSGDNVIWPDQVNSISVGGGDGEAVVTLRPHNSDLVIFKEHSTYRFSYADTPAAGSVSKVSASVGLENQYCIEEHEGIIYTIYQNKIYKFVNYNYEPINTKVPMKYENAATNIKYDQTLSIWSDRLIVTHQDSTYVYQLNTRTWGIWKSRIAGLDYIGKIYPDRNSRKDQPSAFVTSSRLGLAVSGRLWKITDAITDVQEEMFCSIRTKNYDYQSASRFKRLFWWAVDMIGRDSNMEFTVHPIVYTNSLTWGDLTAYRWDQLNTWARPLDVSYDIIDPVEVGGSSETGRKLLKLMKSLRFRQVGFTISATTDGSLGSAPLQIFTLTTYVRVKQSVVQKIS